MKNLIFKNSDKKQFAGKILCIGKNYVDHAKEMGNDVPTEPVVFLKTTSSLIFNNDSVIIPEHSNEVHYEGELVLYIGKNVKNPTIEEAENAIEGYACGLDMTLRDLQRELVKKSHPWTLSKCFDTSAAISEIILKKDYTINGDEKIKLYQNEEVKQNAKIKDMVFHPSFLVKYIADRITLEEGDLIFTGTPAGVGKVFKNDLIRLEIDNIPELKVKIK